MAVFRTILLFVFIFLINDIIIGQKTNPFEIKNRKESNVLNEDNPNITKTKHFEIQNPISNEEIDTTNPFEIKHGKNLNTISKNNKKIDQKPKSNSSFIIVEKNKLKGSSKFLFWIFLFVLVYIAILLTINRALIFKIFKTVWLYNLTNSLLRGFLTRDYLFYLLLAANFVVNLATFVYLVFTKFDIYSGFNFWLILVFAILIIYLAKHLFIYIFEKIFSSLKSLILYNFTILIFNISIGFALIPLNLIIAYGYDFLSMFFMYFSIVIIAFYFVLRLFRGFLLTYSYFNISIVHYFLYLCTFEILPLLFFYKLLKINL